MKPLVAICLILSLATHAFAVQFPFFVYKDGKSKENHYIPSGFTGDYGAILMDESCLESPKGGISCVKFTYSSQPTQGMKWAGVFFQNPANNWGTTKGGFDLSGAKSLRFYARGKNGNEVVEFKMGGIAGTAFSDSDSASTGPLTLSKEWKEYVIDVSKLDLSQILGGFAWVAKAEDNPEGATIYLDEIAYSTDAAPPK
ncbi:MAG: hypothetical protein JO317_02395 [Verrucomicrobiae bacterium]|nr:hypothetical protein [Verrucomicrobiae bacterium]